MAWQVVQHDMQASREPISYKNHVNLSNNVINQDKLQT